MSTTPIGLIIELDDRPSLYVPWQQVTYALFGKNGVGKSRMLSAVRHLFHGGAEGSRYREAWERSTCSVIVEAHLPGHPDREGLPGHGDFLYFYLDHFALDEFDLIDSDVLKLYEQHIQDAGNQWMEPWAVAPNLWRQARQQRFFEISRDDLDQVKVRPCYLESPEHPELSASLAELSEMKDPLSVSPLTVEEIETIDAGHIRFAVFAYEKWSKPTRIDPVFATGHTCMDLRSQREPGTEALGNYLARLLEQGADLEAWAQELSRTATDELHRALQTSVGLHLQVPAHADLLRGKKVEWLATSPGESNVMARPNLLPFERLSTAERTWALLAIDRATALTTEESRGRLLLIDEPEQGLHRAAERQALGWLAGLGRDEGTWVWCATHSPTLLSDERVTPVAVREELHASSGRVTRHMSTRLLGSAERAELESLGLSTTDLLSTRRGFLLVEGAHDETVLTEVIGKDLADLSIEIIPLRGARKLPGAIEARTLFDFTDALVLALLDGIPAEGLSAAWADARKHVDAPEAAHRVLAEGIEWPKNTESEWMQEWLMRSITRGRGRHARVEPLGVSKEDIVEYLPVQSFVAGASSWEDLRSEHAYLRETAKSVPKDFKQWLTKTYRADFDLTTIREACQRLDHIPSDFTNLLRRSASALHAYESDGPI